MDIDEGFHRGRGRGGRAGRGDLRKLILSLLAEQPMHGYQLITVIGERTEGRWTPSPGAVYPILSLLEDEGLITISLDQGRKMARLTPVGEALVARCGSQWAEIVDSYRSPEQGPVTEHALRSEFHRLHEIVKGSPPEKGEEVLRVLRRAAEDISAL
ncbi:PadR family transcriptional regulator [Corynebacterium pacaense]|uniref:PadR family transcriptional regulator n=1 Tax=Corynebacterium pacaense TaxID=1816684 RepID=UPI0009B95983|nr:PadR family transcriptional regulator [Corynebacterium pacaense]